MIIWKTIGEEKNDVMARFKITPGESGKHTWEAVGTNPETGSETIIRGGKQELLSGITTCKRKKF